MARKRLYSLDQNFFEIINTEEKAYWLGFLYADGYITVSSTGQHTLGLKLSQNDLSHLIKYAKALQTNRPIKNRSSQTKYGLIHSCDLIVSSKKIVLDIENKGCFFKKSLILQFPTEKQVPNNLISHFIRGYFDGDGSVFLHSCKTKNNNYQYLGISICGTLEMLQGIKNNLTFIGDDSNIIYPDYRHIGRNIFSLKMLSNIRSQSFYNYIYSNATIFLDRKKEIFDKHLDVLNQVRYSSVVV